MKFPKGQSATELLCWRFLRYVDVLQCTKSVTNVLNMSYFVSKVIDVIRHRCNRFCLVSWFNQPFTAIIQLYQASIYYQGFDHTAFYVHYMILTAGLTEILCKRHGFQHGEQFKHPRPPSLSVEDPKQVPWLQVLVRLRIQSGLQAPQDPHWLQPWIILLTAVI